MIWFLFGAMAVATFVAVGRILIDADPVRTRKSLGFAAGGAWVVGFALVVSGKPLLGLALMAIGAVGVAAVGARRPSALPGGRGAGKADRRRRPAGRRPDFERHADPGPGRSRSGRPSGVMTEEEAYKILGLQPGATTEEIVRAHRALMKKLHPDQGGSTELAARVNAAKDILAERRHG
jgi:hypothetical protein